MQNSYLKSRQLHRARNHPHRKKRSKRSLATDITPDVRMEVKIRDNGMCALCGNMSTELHHVLPRSLGGMGKPKNLISLCKQHHTDYHQGSEKISIAIDNYMKSLYGDIDIKEIKYDKFKEVTNDITKKHRN